MEQAVRGEGMNREDDQKIELSVVQVARLCTIDTAIKHINEAVAVLNVSDFKWTFSAYSPIGILEEKRVALSREACEMAGYGWRSRLKDFATK